jgi:hypothetical protein
MSSRTARYAKRSLHYIAYGSLAIDVTVAFLTLAMVANIITDPFILFIANIILAVTVCATIGLCLVIISIKMRIPLRKKLIFISNIFYNIEKILRKLYWQTKTRYKRWSLTRRRIL